MHTTERPVIRDTMRITQLADLATALTERRTIPVAYIDAAELIARADEVEDQRGVEIARERLTHAAEHLRNEMAADLLAQLAEIEAAR